MKTARFATARFAATAAALLFVVGCGAVDVGGIPVDVGGMNFNGDLNIGDINLGEGEFGDELLDALAGESATDDALNSESETGDEADEAVETEAVETDAEKPHPADTDMDFFIASDELLAYGVAFQDDELDEGQDESWLDVAVSIWQARTDGAYFDDMESIEPLNWISMDESGVVIEIDDGSEDGDDEDGEVVLDDTDTAGEGYDILFKITPLSPASFQLTVVDPTEKHNTDYDSPTKLGWTEGLAWDGFYRVQVYAGDNYNSVNEQVRFSISVYKDGELVLEEEHAVAERELWDDLSVAYP